MDDQVIREAGGNRQFLTPAQLAARWRTMTLTSLMRMRQDGSGPRFVQMRPRGRVLYPLDEVLAFEAARMHRVTRREFDPADLDRRGLGDGA